MKQYLFIAQGIISVFLIVSILLQQRGSSLGSAFGGSGSFHVSRRGAEKKLYWATVVFGVIFVILAMLNLFLK
jgi:protein translocase SecG subunit